jgi:hypothetical protein
MAPSCVNVSRKNYIIKIEKKGKMIIKLTGNTIKSKKLSQYVVDFLDEGFKYLLDGDGLSFVNLYYDHIEKIYNKQIPLAKIANKARVKQSVADYKKHILKRTKSGSLMSRQAHMELLIQNNYNAGLGETIYYVNNGLKKSHGDVQKFTPKKDKTNIDQLLLFKKPEPIPEKVLKINCYMIPESDLINNPEMKGEYNVEKYIANFNKRVESLLVAFNPSMREDILIENPKNRNYFTKKQCELTNGYPLKPKGQDNYDEVMTLSDSEVIFWNKVKRDPFHMYLEDSINYVDQYWVNKNKQVMLDSKGIDNDEEDILDEEEEQELSIEIFV